MKDDGFNLRYDISNPTECTGILERGGTEISLGYSGLCRYHYWFTLHGWRHSMDRHLDNRIRYYNTRTLLLLSIYRVGRWDE